MSTISCEIAAANDRMSLGSGLQSGLAIDLLQRAENALHGIMAEAHEAGETDVVRLLHSAAGLFGALSATGFLSFRLAGE